MVLNTTIIKKTKIILLIISLFLFFNIQLFVKEIKEKDIVLKDEILFYPDTDVVIEEYINKIQALVDNMLKNSDTVIILKGHTNNVGESENELLLSRKRALKIAYYLKDKGIDPERIQTSGFGSKMLKVNKIINENRRVEAIIVSKLKAANVKDLRNIFLDENEKDLSIEIVNENGDGLKSNIEIQDKIDENIITLIKEEINFSMRTKVPNNKSLILFVTSESYMPKKVEIENNENYKKVILEKVAIGKAVSIDNIYFIIQTSEIKSESYDILNYLVSVLKENHKIKIEVIGHTDWPNMELSLQRAQAVVIYLIDKGILKDRLTAKGMSNKEPIAPNNSEKNKQKNRRVEFKFF